ncbi:hypothetical protein [Vibrio sp. B181a]|uniref:hypothetical protein n=1 Tax=Vibrio sp. B181a TaxID=2835906 RepID=UPI002553DDC3|nr:hypothetical protein [Vibrio sp. B181a]MDK9774696.1 hypothetical protein [Vibrio sp. B181a]
MSKIKQSVFNVIVDTLKGIEEIGLEEFNDFSEVCIAGDIISKYEVSPTITVNEECIAIHGCCSMSVFSDAAVFYDLLMNGGHGGVTLTCLSGTLYGSLSGASFDREFGLQYTVDPDDKLSCEFELFVYTNSNAIFSLKNIIGYMDALAVASRTKQLMELMRRDFSY